MLLLSGCAKVGTKCDRMRVKKGVVCERQLYRLQAHTNCIACGAFDARGFILSNEVLLWYYVLNTQQLCVQKARCLKAPDLHACSDSQTTWLFNQGVKGHMSMLWTLNPKPSRPAGRVCAGTTAILIVSESFFDAHHFNQEAVDRMTYLCL